jgi:hypothetical protein
MKVDKAGKPAHRVRRALLPSVLIILLFAVVTTALGVGLAEAVYASLGNAMTTHLSSAGQVFESVAALFSGLAFIALVVTFWLQIQELQLQRLELENQRHEMRATQSELHRSAEADLRALHVELLKMAIYDADLAAVWPAAGTAIGHERRRQHLYANLIYQHLRLALELSDVGEEFIKANLRRIFGSQLMRDFWLATEEARLAALIPETREWEFARMTDEVCRDLASPSGEGSDLVG